VAVLSYLRTLAPVKHPVQQREINLFGRVVEGLMIRPSTPGAPVLTAAPQGPTAARGRYLVDAVANCAGCHTQRSMVTGAFTGPRLAGGLRLGARGKPGLTFVTPNLTPDPDTGRVARWNEELFLARFRLGRGAEGSPMPWPAYATMTDDDLRAIWRHLQAVPPVRNDTGPSVPVTPAVGEESGARAAR
jgi:mono/diheme cytochrome c family protein